MKSQQHMDNSVHTTNSTNTQTSTDLAKQYSALHKAASYLEKYPLKTPLGEILRKEVSNDWMDDAIMAAYVPFGLLLGLNRRFAKDAETGPFIEQLRSNRDPKKKIITETYEDSQRYKLFYGDDGLLYTKDLRGNFELANTKDNKGKTQKFLMAMSPTGELYIHEDELA